MSLCLPLSPPPEAILKPGLRKEDGVGAAVRVVRRLGLGFGGGVGVKDRGLFVVVACVGLFKV